MDPSAPTVAPPWAAPARYRIRIRGRLWTVVTKDLTESEWGDERLAGELHPEVREIWVSSDLTDDPPGHFWTAIHEVLHLARLRRVGQILTERREEMAVRWTEEVLQEVLPNMLPHYPPGILSGP